MSAILPVLSGSAGEPEKSLVHERGGLERVTWRLSGHLRRCQFTKLVINDWKKLLNGLLLALVNTIKDMGQLAHTEV